MTVKPAKRTKHQCVSVTLPELLELSHDARKLVLSASRIKNAQSGFHLSRFLGRGMEFAECRRYQAGDDIRTMDWRVTARTGVLHTKLFSAEKERQVLLCVDMRSIMFFATQGVFKSVQAALMTGYIAWSASQGGNRIGGMIFDDHGLFERRPALGKRGVLPFLQGLAERASYPLKDRQNTQNGDNSIDLAVENIKRVAAPGSLIFMISDFRHLSSRSRDLLIQLSKHNDLCLCFIYDPFEAALPTKGHYPITDGKEEFHVNTHDKKRLEKYQQQFMERKESIQSLSNQRHIHFLDCSTKSDCLELLKTNFN